MSARRGIERSIVRAPARATAASRAGGEIEIALTAPASPEPSPQSSLLDLGGLMVRFAEIEAAYKKLRAERGQLRRLIVAESRRLVGPASVSLLSDEQVVRVAGAEILKLMRGSAAPAAEKEGAE